MRRIWRLGLVSLLGLGLAGCAWLFQPPQAVLTASPTSGTAPLSVTFDLSGSTGQIASYTLAFGDASDPATGMDITLAVSHTYTTPGTYTATLTVQDAQARTSSVSVTITVSAAPVTTVSLAAIPAAGPADLEVDFSATITAAPGRRITHLALDADTDGTAEFTQVVDFATFSGPITTLTYTTPGTHTATLTVTDDAPTPQTFTATATVTVTSLPPVIATFTVTPQTPSAGAAVTFAFTASPAPARNLTRWEISSGDGYVVTRVVPPTATLNVTHIYVEGYAQTGSYTATVRVWDDVNNTDQESRAIVVP